MKKARKFLAMLLCLTLCIVPLPFSVHASANEITPRGLYCSCPDVTYTVVGHGNFLYEVDWGSATVCTHAYYDSFIIQCPNCHIQHTENIVTYKETQHPTFIQVTIDGETVFQCPKCKYIR